MLQRARAIENGAFVISAAQAGRHADGRETFGHSIIVAPWGEVLAEGGGEGPEVIVAEIDPQLRPTRGSASPALKNERPFALPDAREPCPVEIRIVIRYSLSCHEAIASKVVRELGGLRDPAGAGGIVVCPVCGSTDVDKALMAPAVATARKKEKKRLR